MTTNRARRLLPTVGLVLAAVLSAPAADPSAKPAEQRDILGRALPWGEPSGGERASLSIIGKRLLYSQPVELELRLSRADGKPTCVRLLHDGSGPGKVKLSVLDAAGKAVACRARFGGEASGYFTVSLAPTGPHALGRYFKPGRYRVRAQIESAKEPVYPQVWTGRLSTNEVAFEVLPLKGEARRPPLPDALRKKAEKLIAQLDADDFQRRRQAQAALESLSLDVLPLVEKAAEDGSAEAAARAKRIITRLAFRVVKPEWDSLKGPFPRPGPVLARFGQPTWRILRGKLAYSHYASLRVQGACYAPAGEYRDIRKPSPDVAKQIVARLNSNDPYVRLRAARGLSATSDPKILGALSGLLADSFFCCTDLRRMGRLDPRGETGRCYAIREHAREALRWQGSRAVEALIAFAGKTDKAGAREEATRLLGQFGPDKRILRFFRQRIAALGDKADWALGEALRNLGAAGAELDLELARNVKANHTMRYNAVCRLGAGEPKTVGPFVLKMLRNDKSRLVSAACVALCTLKLPASTDDLARICRDKKKPQRTRREAMAALCNNADPVRAGEVLISLLGESVPRGVRRSAVMYLGAIGCRQAVPKLLALLEHPDGTLRSALGVALRQLARKAEGVGFDPDATTPRQRKTQAAKWRRFWKEHAR